MCGRHGWAVGNVEHIGTPQWGAVAVRRRLHIGGGQNVLLGRAGGHGRLGTCGWALGGIAAKLEYPALSSQGLTPGIQKPTSTGTVR